MTREEAKKLAIPHKGKSPVVHVSADGNVFFEPQKADAEFHTKRFGIELFSFSDSELEETKGEVKKEENEIESKKFAELVEYCKEKQYPEEEYKEIKSKKDLLAYVKTKI
jgi:hypothetical protein